MCAKLSWSFFNFYQVSFGHLQSDNIFSLPPNDFSRLHAVQRLTRLSSEFRRRLTLTFNIICILHYRMLQAICRNGNIKKKFSTTLELWCLCLKSMKKFKKIGIISHKCSHACSFWQQSPAVSMKCEIYAHFTRIRNESLKKKFVCEMHVCWMRAEFLCLRRSYTFFIRNNSHFFRHICAESAETKFKMSYD